MNNATDSNTSAPATGPEITTTTQVRLTFTRRSQTLSTDIIVRVTGRRIDGKMKLTSATFDELELLDPHTERVVLTKGDTVELTPSQTFCATIKLENAEEEQELAA